jgi:succinyl-diaminopimelate desuccinylase
MCCFSLRNDLAYPIALQLTTDEELGGFDGTRYQIARGVRTDFVLAGEPTNFDIVHRAKGILWLEIVAKGKTAHGAYPWRGINAIMEMQRFLAALAKAFPNPEIERWKTTVNVARIATTNDAYNKIPGDCTVRLDIRHVPERDHPLATIKRLLPKGFTMKVVVNEPALLTERRDPGR